MSKKDIEATIKKVLADFTSNTIRNDPAGSGTFGASRAGGTRVHKGKDYEVAEGDAINSPVLGKVTKIGYPYGDDLSYRYIQVTDMDGNDHRMFYVSPDKQLKVGDTVKQGDKVGTAQDVAKKHGGEMKTHVHYEILDPAKKPIDEDEYRKRRVASTSAGRQGKGEQP